MGSKSSTLESDDGEVMKTTRYDVGQRATSRAFEANSDYACCIAINNTTEYSLRNPSCYICYGNDEGLPRSIDSDYTGFITVKNTFGGLSGLISYDIMTSDGRNKTLQIMWYVPPFIVRFLSRCSVKIRIGTETASGQLYEKMYYCKSNEYGVWNFTDSTPRRILCLDRMFEVEVLMANKSKTSLIVELRKRH